MLATEQADLGTTSRRGRPAARGRDQVECGPQRPGLHGPDRRCSGGAGRAWRLRDDTAAGPWTVSGGKSHVPAWTDPGGAAAHARTPEGHVGGARQTRRPRCGGTNLVAASDSGMAGSAGRGVVVVAGGAGWGDAWVHLPGWSDASGSPRHIRCGVRAWCAAPCSSTAAVGGSPVEGCAVRRWCCGGWASGWCWGGCGGAGGFRRFGLEK